MKKNYNLLLFLLILVLNSCDKSMDDRMLSSSEIATLSTETISVDDALCNLTEAIIDLNLETKSRTTATLSKDNVFAIGAKELSVTTKSNDDFLPDTLLYAINFMDGGFAIMAGNSKINEPIMCITEQGSISVDDISKGVGMLNGTIGTKSCESNDDEEFEAVGKQYLYSLLVSAAILDYNDTISLQETPITKESGSSTIGPLVRTKWDQGTPFDKFTPNNYAAGCVVAAVMQIMAYHERPYISQLNNVSSPWDTLKTVYPDTNYKNAGSNLAQNQVAQLSVEIGNSNNCDVSYTATGSSSTVTKAKKTFENYGYDVTKHIGCVKGDRKRIDSSLANKRPVYMQGQRKDAVTGDQKGHAWVIDGYKGDLYHINWGWHGDADGYYAKGVFETASINSYASTDPKFNSYTGSNNRNYYHYFRYLICAI